MKKDIKKRFFLAAMVASLALLWGGVTSCSNGNDDETEDIGTTGVTITFDENEKEVKKASEIPEKATSIKITVTGVTGTTTDASWWFWAKTAAGDGDNIEWKSGEAENAIYELTVSNETKIAYIKENGLYVKGASGLSAKVTVDITESTNDSSSGDNVNGDNTQTPGGSDDNEGTESGTTTTLPTAVVLAGYVDGNASNFNNSLATMTESSTKGVYTAEVNISDKWVNFQVVATVNEKAIWYKGGEAKLNESCIINTDGAGNIYCNVGEGINKILVTVDFTNPDAPTIKITTTE